MAGRMTDPFVVLHDPALVARFAEEPWEVARVLSGMLGGRVQMIERQPIRPVGGRSFASNKGPAPLHTDSQLYRGKPANFQVLGCVRAAKSGGESTIADVHATLDTVSTALADALFGTPRTFPFVFGDVLATTLSAVGDELVFTHSPRLDAIGEALVPHLRPEHVLLSADDILIVDNHRCAHGRTAFADTSRELQRILIWVDADASPPSRAFARAKREGRAPERITDRAVPSIDPELQRKIVEAMVRGVPPGVLAQRHHMPEPWLYAMRDAMRDALTAG